MGRSPAVAVVAGIVLIVSVLLIARQMGLLRGAAAAPTAPDVFWYDLETGKLFGHRVSPARVTAPSGGAALRAHVFACNDCDDPNDRFIAYFEQFTDEARRVLQDEQRKSNPMSLTMAMGHVRVRRPDSREWVIATHPDGLQVVNAPLTWCGGQPATPCLFPD